MSKLVEKWIRYVYRYWSNLPWITRRDRVLKTNLIHQEGYQHGYSTSQGIGNQAMGDWDCDWPLFLMGQLTVCY